MGRELHDAQPPDHSELNVPLITGYTVKARVSHAQEGARRNLMVTKIYADEI